MPTDIPRGDFVFHKTNQDKRKYSSQINRSKEDSQKVMKARIPEELPPQPETNPPPYISNQATTVPQQPVGMAYIAPSAPVIIQTAPVFGTEPSSYVCPSCHATIVTRTEKKVTTKTHLFALAMCAVGLWCCCCIPYCMDSCHNIDHYCPHCNAYIGTSRN